MSKSFIFFDEEIMKGAERTLRNASENIKNEINTINRSLSSISRINECKLINNEFSSVLTSPAVPSNVATPLLTLIPDSVTFSAKTVVKL